MTRYKETGSIDIKRTVEKIRTQRAHAVERPEQYVFCYKAIADYAQECPWKAPSTNAAIDVRLNLSLAALLFALIKVFE
jgi:hypothetical protein